MKKTLALFAIVFAAVPSWAFTAKFFSSWKTPVEVATGGKLVLAHPGNYNGKMFVGWKYEKNGPSGAIPRLTAEERRKAKAATVVHDPTHCLACTENLPCDLCVRRCPNQAIRKVDGRPVVDATKCTGCGACVHYCPTVPSSFALS